MQSDTNPDVHRLLNAFTTIPPLVKFSKDVPVAEEIISEVSQVLGAGPASRPAVHPRPAVVGICWDNLDDDALIKYDAVVDLLSAETPHVTLEPGSLEQALRIVRDGKSRLAPLPQQGYSGMVQRHLD